MSFEKIKSLISNYYNQKNFDLEHEINLKLMNNLDGKLNEMRSEFYQIKNEKMMLKTNLEKAVEELAKALASKNCMNRNKIENEHKFKSAELEKVNHDLNLLELNCKKKETLFNKYIILLRNRCRKSKEESYYEMNPSLIIESEFEDKLKEEVLKLIDQDSKFSDDDKLKFRNIIEVYFKDLIEREKSLQSSIALKKKISADKEQINIEINQILELIGKVETEILAKKQSCNEMAHREKVVVEKIEKRNKSISSNLEKMGELEFENYLKSNDNVLKNMKKIYGNKVLDKVFKAQKQKFLENVILDHSYKKSKVNEYLKSIAEFESAAEFYSQRLLEVENQFKQAFQEHENLINTRKTKVYERLVVEESKKDLKAKIEEMVQQQFMLIESEKRHLENKYNISYFLEKIHEVKSKIEACVQLKTTLETELKEFRNSVVEKEDKLYREDIELKNTLITMRSKLKSDEFNTNAMTQPNITKDIYSVDEVRHTYSNEDLRKSKDEANYDLPLAKPNQVFVEEIHLNEMMSSNINTNYINTDMSNNKSVNKSLKDPILTLVIEKVRPLTNGITLYKKFNQNSIKSKVYDPLNPTTTPENCGYATRNFKFNANEEVIEIYNLKNRHLESKIPANQVKGISLSHSTKQIVRNLKELNKKPNKEQERTGDNLPFFLLYSGGSLDLCAPNFNTLEDFTNAIEELVKNRKSVCSYFKTSY